MHFDGITIDVNGSLFRVTVEQDSDHGEPWNEEDGHGVISEWTQRAKKPGEMILCSDRDQHRFYDISATMRIAVRDEWGPQIPYRTPQQAAAAAVQADYQRMRAWCNDDWRYVGVIVKALDGSGRRESLWGIESDSDYWKEVARELAEQILSEG